jgi:hypothetical protein
VSWKGNDPSYAPACLKGCVFEKKILKTGKKAGGRRQRENHGALCRRGRSEKQGRPASGWAVDPPGEKRAGQPCYVKGVYPNTPAPKRLIKMTVAAIQTMSQKSSFFITVSSYFFIYWRPVR